MERDALPPQAADARLLLLTCEHGGRRVPTAYQTLFAPHTALLRTHRGWDIGALRVARILAAELSAPLIAATVTRLLVDLNRSLRNPTLHSEVTNDLPADERARILEAHYRPHWDRVTQTVAAAVERGQPTVHIASHSFTPILGAQVRTADIGLLYDPKRAAEAALAGRWLAQLKRLRPELRLRRNYPYLGDSDGLARSLRRRHADAAYVGIELEVNQALLQQRGAAADQLALDLARSLHQALQE